MKYIMLKVNLAGCDKLVPVIFPDFMIHRSIAGAVSSILSNEHKFSDVQVYSAGDINLDEVT